MSINTVNDNENTELINNDLSIDLTTDREVNNINAPEFIRVNPPSKYEITQQQISAALSLDMTLYSRLQGITRPLSPATIINKQMHLIV